jgi:hypothetical protein
MVSILAAISSAAIRFGGLKRAASGSTNGPGCGSRRHGVDAGRDPMKGEAFLEHALDDWDDGAFERNPSQLSGTACGLGKIIADAECNGTQCCICGGFTTVAKRSWG